MQAKKPLRRRTLTTLGIILLVVVVAAGGGFLYLRTIGSASAAERTDPDPADGNTAQASDTTGKQDEADGEDEGKTAIPVSVMGARRGAVSSYVSATSNLVAENEVQVLAEAEGRVDTLLVEEGQAVRKGQLLAALAQDDARIAYDKANVKAANAEAVYQRAQRLGEQGLITQEELDRSRMEHRVAQQELAEAQWRLDRTEIRAPFDGRITGRNLTVGQHVRPGDELFTVSDFDPLIARIYLPEKDILGLEEGRDVRITLKADERVVFRGRTRQISPVVDTATGTVKLTIEAIQPPRQVRPGGFVNIDIVRETHADAILLPRQAVIRELQSAHVFVARDDNTAERRDITLGLEEGDQVEVTSGLVGGERVVVAGQGGLKDGASIKIIPGSTQRAFDLSPGADSSANGST